MFGMLASPWDTPTSAQLGSYSATKLSQARDSTSSIITCSSTRKRVKKNAVKSSSSSQWFGTGLAKQVTRHLPRTAVTTANRPRMVLKRTRIRQGPSKSSKSSTPTTISTRWARPATRSTTSTKRASSCGCAKSSHQCTCARRQEML